MTRMKFFALALAAGVTLGGSVGLSSDAWAVDAKDGAKVFKSVCKTCHRDQKGKNAVGPSLYGVIGRTAGTVENFKYSDGMKGKGEAGLVWNDADLTTYLHDPDAFVPGNKMALTDANWKRAKMDKDEAIAAVIMYLDTLHD